MRCGKPYSQYGWNVYKVADWFSGRGMGCRELGNWPFAVLVYNLKNKLLHAIYIKRQDEL